MNHKTSSCLVFMFLCCFCFTSAQPPLPIFTEPASVIQGEEFCVDITVNDFEGVESFQYSMSWDPTLFDYQSTIITDVPDPGFFGVGEIFVDSGILTVSWNNDFANGLDTMPDGTSFYQLCFIAIGTPDTCSVINFVNLPLGIEVVTAASGGMDIGLDQNLGNMCIVEELDILDTLITPADCGTTSGGAIAITMTGGLAPYDVNWTGPSFSASTEDISGLGAGTYYVTATDASTPANIMLDSFEVVSPEFSTSYAGVDTAITCTTTVIELNGEVEPNSNDIFVEWFTNDGNITTDSLLPFVDIDMPGTYYFVAFNASSLCADTSFLVVELNNTSPIANAGTGGELTCDQTTLTLDGSGSSQGSDLVYVWTTSGTGNIVSGDSTLTPLVDAPGNYILTVVDPTNGCPPSTSSVQVTQDVALPMAVAGVDTVITCEFPEINLNGTGSSTIGVTYQWFTIGGYITGNGTSLFPSVNAEGIYGLIVTNSANCSDTSYVNVTSVMDNPVANAGSDQTMECGQFIVLLDGSGSASGDNILYNWTTTGGIIFEGTSAVAEVGSAGTYELEVTNEDNGCTSVSTVEVTMDTIPPSVVVADGPTINCDITSVILDATGTSTGTDFIYEWNTFEGEIQSGSTTLMPTVVGGGVYVILVQDTSNSCLSTGVVNVIIDTIPPLADPGLDTILNCEQPLTLDGSNSDQGAGITYLWTTGDGSIVSGGSTLTPVVGTGGTYTLTTTSENNGCSDVASVFVDGGVDLVDADVGMDFDICEDSTLLMGNLPMGTSGVWTSSSTATILMPDTMETWVQGMDAGAHLFIWTLSTDECPDYNSDTLTVQAEGQPIAEEDSYTFFADLPVQELLLTENDDVSAMLSWDVTLIDVPSEVVITPTGSGNFDLTNPGQYFGMLSFDYALCSETCPDICDTTQVLLNIEEPIDTITQIANAITPNGDGLNDLFIIPEISMDPGKYPDNVLVIFNRWGDVVYRANPYFNDWSGTDESGNDLPQGTYYYQITLDISNSYQGDITILK